MKNRDSDDNQRRQKLAEIGARLVRTGEALTSLVGDSKALPRKLVEVQDEIEKIREHLYELRFGA